MPDTKLTIFQADSTTAAIDYRTEATNGDGRQVITIGDPSVNNNVAIVATQDATGQDQLSAGLLVRHAGSITLGPSSNSIGAVTIGSTVAVYFDRGDPGVNVSKVYGVANGTLTVKIDPAGAVFNNAGHTASIFTVSGSTSGVSASGVNLIAPSSAYNFKIFAYSIQTTGVTSVVPRFVNGSGGGQTEFWRPLITASSSTSAPIGANLAVQPPGYIFATGTNTSLNLHLDTGVLVHYSLSYIKESA